MKAFIIMYNRLTWPRLLAERLTQMGCEVILIDNNSTYPPLLEWYLSCPYKLHRFDINMGHQALWKSGIINTFTDQYYIVTDGDLDITNVPNDMVSFLLKGLIHNPDVIKSGLSLMLDDLPDNDYTKMVHDWEIKFWQTQNRPFGFYKSDIDTTLAVYDRTRIFGELPNDRFFSAVRSPMPYTARHLPWYLTNDMVEADDEEKYYLENTNTYWATKFKETMK